MGIDDLDFTPFVEKQQKLFSTQQKLSVASIAVGIYHASLIFLFIYLKSWPMVVFNIGSVFVYIFALGLVKHNQNTTSLLVIIIEVAAHSMTAMVMVGWDMGFQLYLIALIPSTYYIIGNHLESKQAVSATIFGSVTAYTCFGMCYFTSKVSSYQTIEYPALTVEIIFTLNVIVTMIVSTLFIALLTQENYIIQNNLENNRRELDQLTKSDMLTGLYNRSSMREFFDLMFDGSKNYYITILDIDNLREINAAYSHECGDILLKNLAKIIMNTISYSGYASRWSGQEILILNTYASQEEAYEDADHMRTLIESSQICYHGNTVGCTVTVGVAHHEIADTFKDTIFRAEQFVKEGKESGRNITIMHMGKR